MRTAIRAWTLLAPGLCLGWSAAVAPALAGPATYDKDSKSFHLTYTFANLAGAGIGDQVVGAAQKPTPDEEATVNALAAQVSDVLFKVTEGRAKIGALDYVDDIKNADIVVSRTGQPASGGWANRGAINNTPGYLVLYYQTLLPYIKQDVVYTGAHEFSHYAFNLVDEYAPNASSPCPGRSGPGCLMDNYFSSMRGYMGRYCTDAEHTASADQPQSCQSIVDKFFSDRGVTKDPAAVASSGTGGTDPRTSLVATAIGKVRAKRLEDLARKKPGSPSGAGTGGLRTFAKGFLTDLIGDFNRNNPNGANQAIFTPSQISKAIDMIVRVGTVVPALKPVGLGLSLFRQIENEAARIGTAAAPIKSEAGRVAKIRSELRGFVAQMEKNNLFDKDDFPRDQQKDLVERLARSEGRSEADKNLDRLLGLSDINARMTQDIAANIVDVLDELDAPGIPARRAALRGFDTELKKFAIPGRTAARFGRRRTRFINPDPYDPAGLNRYDLVVTQGGIFPYVALRDRGFNAFARLIDRSRIELVEPRFSAESLLGGEPIDVRIDRPFEAAGFSNMPRIKAQRNTNFQALLADLYDQIQRDRLENVAVLVPPGGLPPGLEQSLDVLRAKLRGVDVRLDIILVGPAVIPSSLRDLSVRSGGSVLTITDIDEVGALGQRLKNEQTSGSWLVVPQQGTIPENLVSKSLDPLEIRRSKDCQIELTKTLTKQVRTALGIASAVDLTPADATSDVIERGKEAKVVLAQMRLALGNLERDARDKELGIRRDDPVGSGPNATMMRDIAFFKRQIESAKKLVELGQKLAPRADPAGPDLLIRTSEMLGRMLVGFGHIPAPSPDKSDPLVRLSRMIETLQQEQNLGEGLTNLDRLCRLYEKILDDAYDLSGDSVPIYKRIDRARLEVARRNYEAAGNPNKPSPIDSRNDQLNGRLRLARFYAEDDAVAVGKDVFDTGSDLELIVGLSAPLPKLVPPAAVPTLELYGDANTLVDRMQKVQFDTAKSTDTLLVFRIEYPRTLPEAAYTPFLVLDPRLLTPPNDLDINFTFSVGSTRHNVQLLAAVIDDVTDNSRGTLRSSDRDAVIEVHVSAGSAVLGAKVVGFYQEIIPGNGDIPMQSIVFQDGGQLVRTALGDQPEYRDKQKDDGIYTAAIPINHVAGVGHEFRVFIQADTTDGQARYIPLDDPNRGSPEKNDPTLGKDDKRADQVEKTQGEIEGKALRFQRATSLHFRVDP